MSPTWTRGEEVNRWTVASALVAVVTVLGAAVTPWGHRAAGAAVMGNDYPSNLANAPKDSLVAAREWLKTAHPELGQRAPLEAALTEIGARRVEALLTSLYYGLPA